MSKRYYTKRGITVRDAIRRCREMGLKVNSWNSMRRALSNLIVEKLKNGEIESCH